MKQLLTKTIYSICYPQTQKCIDDFLKNPEIPSWYTHTWTKKQDVIHHDFIHTWKKWSHGGVNVDWKDFPQFYPTAGSSEAIREQIVHLHSKGHCLVVFEGEYEGYEAMANAINMPLIKLKRKTDRESLLLELKRLDFSKDVLFLSQPSSIDGNFWSDYDFFMSQAQDLKTYVDLTYLGATQPKEKINLFYKNIEGIFFSLSKIFGVYYHRIGGVLLKSTNPLLYGNMWFKNILSIKLGQKILEDFPIYSNHEKMKMIQSQAIEKIRKEYSVEIVPSDVFIIGTMENKAQQWQKEFIRQPDENFIRICLSPIMEEILRK